MQSKRKAEEIAVHQPEIPLKVKADLSDDGLTLFGLVPDPTEEELGDWMSDKIVLEEGTLYGCIFFAFKAGGQPWADMPFHPGLSLYLTKDGMARLKSREQLPVEIILSSGLLSYVTWYTTSPEFRSKFCMDCEKLLANDRAVLKAEEIQNAACQKVYALYSIRELAILLSGNSCVLRRSADTRIVTADGSPALNIMSV